MAATAFDTGPELQDRAVCPWMQGHRCHNETINPQPHDVDKCLVCLLAELVRELQIRREG